MRPLPTPIRPWSLRAASARSWRSAQHWLFSCRRRPRAISWPILLSRHSVLPRCAARVSCGQRGPCLPRMPRPSCLVAMVGHSWDALGASCLHDLVDPRRRGVCVPEVRRLPVHIRYRFVLWPSFWTDTTLGECFLNRFGHHFLPPFFAGFL